MFCCTIDNTCAPFFMYTPTNTKRFSLSGKTSWCKVIKVYDGDTLTIILPLHSSRYIFTCRLYGIDAAELKSTGKEHKVACDARVWLSKLINKRIIIECGKFDKYGRLLGTFFENSKDYVNDLSINQKLISKGFAYEYKGKTKRKFKDWHSPRIKK